MIRRLGLAVGLVGLVAMAGPAFSSGMDPEISPPSSIAEPVQLASFFAGQSTLGGTLTDKGHSH
jgi:hypothetical protein